MMLYLVIIKKYKRMQNKQTAVEWLKKLFKQKSSCCKEKMNSVDIHLFSNGSESLIYQCNKCQKLWI